MENTVADTTYTATFSDSSGDRKEELEFIAGLPQKSVIRPRSAGGSGDADGSSGAAVDVVWQLDPDEAEFTYRPSDSEGYGEAGAH